MSISVEVKAVGEATTVILPAEVLERLRVRVGDRLQLSETASGFELRAAPADFERKMACAATIMREDHSLLRRLVE